MAEDAEESEEDQPEAEESGSDPEGSDGQPSIEDDEMADWSAVADSVDEDAAEDDLDGDGEESEVDSDSSASESESDESSGSSETAEGSVTLGRVYCNALGVGAATARDRFGDLDMDREEAVEEYRGLAEQLEIDEYIDEWMATRGGIDELPPHVAALLMTLAFAGMVAAEDPELANNALDSFDGAEVPF